MQPLVLVAHRYEAKYLPADTDLVLTGVGMTRAAYATTRAILERCPDPARRAELTVVNLGSVGALRDDLAGIHEPSAVINRDTDTEIVRSLGLEPDEPIPLPGHGPVLGTGDSFVAGGQARARLLEHCDLVDMEGYSVAYACRELGVRLRMIKHVSDAADERALEWKDLVDVSARALAEAYADLIGHELDT